MATTYTLTGQVTDALDSSPEALTRLSGYAEASQALINDTGTNTQRVGRVPLTFDSDGNFTVALVGTGSLVAGWRVVLNWRDSTFRSQEQRYSTGYFTMTANKTFAAAIVDGGSGSVIPITPTLDVAVAALVSTGSATSTAVTTATKSRRVLDHEIEVGVRIDGERPRVTLSTSATQIASGTAYQPSFSGSNESANAAWWVGGTPVPCIQNAGVRARAPQIPGGSAQAARWVPARRFTTGGATFEYQGLVPGSTFQFALVVDGKVSIHNGTINIGSSGAFVYVLFDFGTARTRTIDLYILDPDFYCLKCPTGFTIVKPANQPFGRALYIEGDSLSAGANGIDRTGVYGFLLARALGYDHVINGAVGGTAWVSGTAGTTFVDRLASNVTPYIRPHDGLIIAGSRNDTGSAGPITSAVTSTLATLTSVQQLALIGTFTNLPTPNNAVKAGALAAGRPFIDGSGYFTGTGFLDAPAYDGNYDRYFASSDNVHPILPVAHEYLARRIALDAAEVMAVPITL